MGDERRMQYIPVVIMSYVSVPLRENQRIYFFLFPSSKGLFKLQNICKGVRNFGKTRKNKLFPKCKISI